MTVAAAAPAIPVFKAKMKIMSRRIFIAEEMIIALKGVLPSPMARSIPEQRLYETVTASPPKIILPYRRVSFKIWGSVCIMLSRSFMNIRLSAVRTRAIMAHSFTD